MSFCVALHRQLLQSRYLIGPEVPQESVCLITLQGLQVMQMLVSIPIHWLITSHFLEPFHSYLY